MSKFIAYVFVFFCLLFSLPSFALGKLGHQLVCQLAFEHLSTTKQQKITQLLHAIPIEEQQRINLYNNLNKNSPIYFSNACTWADTIKKLPIYKKYNSWHYINVPRNYTSIPKNSCKDNCLPRAIIQHQKLLNIEKVSLDNTPKVKDRSTWETTQALLFLGHWLGDIHQPLHVSYASDLGGNKIRLQIKRGRCNSLHWYWDSCLLSLSKRTKAKWISTLKSQWSNVKVYPYSDDDVWKWADESYQIITKPSFQYCNLVNINNEEQRCQEPLGKVSLAHNYHVQHLPILELQLVKAAKRLKNILDASL